MDASWFAQMLTATTSYRVVLVLMV